MDYAIWGILEQATVKSLHPSFDPLNEQLTQSGARSLMTLEKVHENVFITMIRKLLQIMVVLLHKPIVYNLNIFLCKFHGFVEMC